MPKRKAIGKKVRFEVFKRDSFTCQYCGAASPDAVLHVDHIKPVSKGGDNEIVNLITSCAECNLGKGAREIDDDAAIRKQRDQLEELNERREQLEMMLEWREEMRDLSGSQVDAVCDEFESISHGMRVLNERGRNDAKALIRKYGLNDVLEAMEIAQERYVEYDEGGAPSPESVSLAWSKVKGICYYRSQPEDYQQLAYIRGIVRNRTYCTDQAYCMKLLRDAWRAGVDVEELSDLAKSASNWTNWQCDMHDLIERGGQ